MPLRHRPFSSDDSATDAPVTDALPTHFAVDLPSWLGDFASQLPESFSSDEEAMRWVNEAARRNHTADTGGPFAAFVVESDSGRLVSVGVNLVLASNLSLAHAEVVAIGLAHSRLGTWNLREAGSPAHSLIVNARPCVLCGGAALWSGVSRIVFGASGEDVETLTGFDEGPVHPDWVGEMARRDIEVVGGVLAEECRSVLREYGQRDDAVVYNAR